MSNINKHIFYPSLRIGEYYLADRYISPNHNLITMPALTCKLCAVQCGFLCLYINNAVTVPPSMKYELRISIQSLQWLLESVPYRAFCYVISGT